MNKRKPNKRKLAQAARRKADEAHKKPKPRPQVIIDPHYSGAMAATLGLTLAKMRQRYPHD